MVVGKRAEGVELAGDVALFGWPRQPDYDTWTAVTLARSAAVAALAKSVVTALSIDRGGVGPRDFYDSEDEYLKALLRSRLPRPSPK